MILGELSLTNLWSQMKKDLKSIRKEENPEYLKEKLIEFYEDSAGGVWPINPSELRIDSTMKALALWQVFSCPQSPKKEFHQSLSCKQQIAILTNKGLEVCMELVKEKIRETATKLEEDIIQRIPPRILTLFIDALGAASDYHLGKAELENSMKKLLPEDLYQFLWQYDNSAGYTIADIFFPINDTMRALFAGLSQLQLVKLNPSYHRNEGWKESDGISTCIEVVQEFQSTIRGIYQKNFHREFIDHNRENIMKVFAILRLEQKKEITTDFLANMATTFLIDREVIERFLNGLKQEYLTAEPTAQPTYHLRRDIAALKHVLYTEIRGKSLEWWKEKPSATKGKQGKKSEAEKKKEREGGKEKQRKKKEKEPEPPRIMIEGSMEVRKGKKEFEAYLRHLVDERLQQTIEFGKGFSAAELEKYLRGLFGDMLFFDSFLTILQQYSICDAEVVSEEETAAMRTGFNLSLFGEPGTGKTFPTHDIIIGKPDKGIPPHGLPGKNRYCGGMTPSKFIEVGQAYEGEKFNFIITEFKDWFKDKGMVEPLKLAMERGTIIRETKTYKVGPYKFDSFFSVNYNVKTSEKGYQLTMSDPNFNAIEDRALCRLHTLTKERYDEIANKQIEIITGQMKMEKAQQIRDHLTLIYAIETQHPFVKDKFQYKSVKLTDSLIERIKKAREAILSKLSTIKVLGFSPRVETRAIQLASVMSLLRYFQSTSDTVEIDPDAIAIAVRFYVEEASVRSQQVFDPKEVLTLLGYHE